MKSLLLFVLLLPGHYSFADAWDNLTRQQAEAVVAELEKNPFVFDYCDCCDDDGEDVHAAMLLQVTSTEIVACSWSPEMFSVKYEAISIGEVCYHSDTLSVLNMFEAGSGSSEYVVYMNYSRGLNPTTKQATNFFNIVDYDYYGENLTCKREFDYPHPKELKKAGIKLKAYAKWYRRKAR